MDDKLIDLLSMLFKEINQSHQREINLIKHIVDLEQKEVKK